MITYILDIDRVGTLTITLNGASPEDFCRFAHKAGKLNIPIKMINSFGQRKTMSSSYQYKDVIENILIEFGAQSHKTDVFDSPRSLRPNQDVNITVKSFELGDIHLVTSKFSAIFYRIISNMFKRQLYVSGENDYIISSVDYNLFEHFIQELRKSNFITTPLDPMLSLLPKNTTGPINPIVLVEESDKDGWSFRINVHHGTNDPAKVEQKLDELISFVFPNKAESINSTDTDLKVVEINTGLKKIYYFRCSYRDAKAFQLILEKNGFNTVALQKVLDIVVSKGVLEKTRIDGEIDGFKSDGDIDNVIKKYEKLFFRNSSLPKTKQHFFKAQIDGIKFLYSRQSALLGDSVGVGKTLQFIAAADIRLKVSGGNCLILTKNAVVPQLAIEIQRITGVSDSDISEDWSAPAKWTVLPYQLFEEDALVSTTSPTPLREIATTFLANLAKSGKFTICILDEVHMIKNGNPEKRNIDGYLKHGDSHRTFNVQEVTKSIPFVWGASATIIANKPIDLFNQLRAINHNAGMMDFDVFKSKFGGNSLDELDKFRKADLIRYLLTDQGIYLSRTKKEVNPNIPPINSSEKRIYLTDNEVDEIMKKAKNKDRPSIQEMSTIREKIALVKMDNTISLAKSVLESGRKVGIFTSHSRSLIGIKYKLELLMEFIYPGQNKKVASIAGGQDRKTRQKEIEAFKAPGSDYMAIVISIEAGGTGLDFPNILTDVIVNDFDWSPSDDDQSIGRFYRINSTSPVNVTYVIAENTLDQRFFNMMKQKKEIAERIQLLSDEEKTIVAGSSGDELKQLLAIRSKKWEELKLMSDLDRSYDALNATKI